MDQYSPCTWVHNYIVPWYYIIFSLNAETESTAESELDVTPTSKMIQFCVRDEVGTLGNALQIFSVSCA